MTHVEQRQDLAVGQLLAEGGEGRVFELRDRRDLVFKAYRSTQPFEPISSVVDWKVALGERDPVLARRLSSAAAWPSAVVVDQPVASTPGAALMAAGVIMARAPRRFSLRHRDTSAHLANLSYLTADPARRSAAYGIPLPAPCSPDRLALVYALARVTEALEGAVPPAGHGDLSAHNVLWSFERGPEVYLLDCDNTEIFDPAATPGRVPDPASVPPRRRAATPNWEDPAVPPGSNPTSTSDRYSLGLVFLRVFGAAHFPIQARQRLGGALSIRFELPRPLGLVGGFGRQAPIWELCAASLNPKQGELRPGPGEWVPVLEGLLDEMGASALSRRVRQAQDGSDMAGPGPGPGRGPTRRSRSGPGEGSEEAVEVYPVPARPRVETWGPAQVGGVARRGPADGNGLGRGVRGYGAGGYGTGGLVAGGSTSPAGAGLGRGGAQTGPGRGTGTGGAQGSAAGSAPGPSLAQFRASVRRMMLAWYRLHGEALGLVLSRSSVAGGVAWLVLMLVVDLLAVAVSLLFLGVITAPIFGR